MFILQALIEEQQTNLYGKENKKKQERGGVDARGEVWFLSLTPWGRGWSSASAPTARQPRGLGAVPGKGAAPLNFGPEAFGQVSLFLGPHPRQRPEWASPS